MTLPELPPSVGLMYDRTGPVPAYTDTEMRAYGEACAEAAKRDALEWADKTWQETCNQARGYEREKVEILRAANTKLVGAIDMIRETLNGGNVEDLLLIINNALADYRKAQKPSEAQQFGADLWSGLYGN